MTKTKPEQVSKQLGEYQLSENIPPEALALAMATVKSMEKRKFTAQQMHLASMVLVDIVSKRYIEELVATGEASSMGENQTLTAMTPNFHHTTVPINSENADAIIAEAKRVEESSAMEDQELMISKILAEEPARLFGIDDAASAISALARATGSLFVEMGGVPDDGTWQVGKVRYGDYDVEVRVGKRAQGSDTKDSH